MQMPPNAEQRRARRRPRRRRPPALLVILVVGLVALAVVFAVARALQKSPPSVHGRYIVGAWTFGDGADLDRAVRAGALTEVSCDWLQSRADGSLAAPRFVPGFSDRVHRAGLQAFVTLTDYDQAKLRFDGSISAAILASPQTLRAHAQLVAGWVKTNGFDGVDVDWEAVGAGRRDAFTAFVAALAAAAHADGLEVAVDVYPKLSEPGGWDGPRSQDWAALGAAVDQFRVMTYNYSGSWSGPGPLSPPAWMDRVLSFAETRVAPHKVIMGVGFYGRSWRLGKTTDLLWTDVQQIIADQAPRLRRGASRELTLHYRSGGRPVVAYFPDATAVAAKLRVLHRDHPRVGGIYCWLMGQEDPAVWPLMAARLR
jgi:spore germination protein